MASQCVYSAHSEPEPQGADLISSSGATAVFILESAVAKGLQFNSVWSVGNAKQIGVEDVLQYMDETFDPQKTQKLNLSILKALRIPTDCCSMLLR